jgi:hypothetical protein
MMDKVAAGDMTVNFKANSRDELGELGRGVQRHGEERFTTLIERVGHTVGEVERQAGQVESRLCAKQSGSGRATHADRAGGDGDEPDVGDLAGGRAQCRGGVSSAHSVNDETISGRGLVESQQGSIAALASEIDQSVLVINQLASDSQSISRVLEVIKSIAEQTNSAGAQRRDRSRARRRTGPWFCCGRRRSAHPGQTHSAIDRRNRTDDRQDCTAASARRSKPWASAIRWPVARWGSQRRSSRRWKTSLVRWA